MSVKASAKSDWDADEEDDNWDDWGEGDDDFQEAVSQQDATHSTAKAQDETSAAPQPKDTASMAEPKEKVASEPPTSSTWGSVWKPWGGVVSSVLTTATEGLGNITSTMSQGLNQVIGVPDPEEMARINAAEVAKLKETQQSKSLDRADEAESFEDPHGVPQSSSAFGLNLVTSLGSKVLNTGLDTLEGIGKKTMTILQENDPMLKNKRKMLGIEAERPNLSEVLKEAKQDAEQMENTLKEMRLDRSKERLRFDLLFENNCGLVHLEALEILSKESTLKLETLRDSVSGKALKELVETLEEVKELTEMEDLEGSDSDGKYEPGALNEQLLAALEDADVAINFDDIVANWTEVLAWFESAATDGDSRDGAAIYAKGLATLAEICAMEMCKLHKIAELFLVKEHHSTASEVDGIVQLCRQFISHLHGSTNRFAASLTAHAATAEDGEETKTQINALFAEMLVAVQHLEKAFKLFLPILQIGAV